MSDTQTQAALALDTLGKPTARFGAVTTFPQMDNYSTSTGHRIVHGHVKATGAKAWDLWLDPKPGANAGVLVVQFPDDSAAINVFIEKYGLTFPEPSYRCDVKFTVVWRKVRYGNRPGSTNVVQTIELLPEDTVTDQVADKTTLKTEFPRDDDNQPADHWIDDKGARGAFWAKVTPWIKWTGFTAKPDVFVHDVIGEVHAFTDGYDAAVEAICKAAMRRTVTARINRAMTLQDFIDAIGYSSLEDARSKGMLTDKEIMKLMDDYLASDKHKGNEPQTQQPASTPPQTQAPEAPPAGATDAGAIPLPDTTENATATISDGKTTPVASGMSEAGFSMNFFWCDADGAETQFTMREATWQAGLANVEKFKAGLRALGYMPKAEYAKLHGVPSAAPVAAATPAPADSDKGAVKAVMIKVGSSFNGGKPQLEFECDGFEHPLRYTKESAGLLAQLLKDVRKLDGTPFTAADMETGKKHIGNWTIDWQKTEKDGKTYYNVMRVRAA